MELAPVAAARHADGFDGVESPPLSPKFSLLRDEGCLDKKKVGQQYDGSWMPVVMLGCWTTLLADAAEANRAPASTSRSERPSALSRCWTS